jgi:hypothetical protein
MAGTTLFKERNELCFIISYVITVRLCHLGFMVRHKNSYLFKRVFLFSCMH